MADCGCYSHGSFLTAKGLKEAEKRRGDSFLFDGVDKRQLSLYLDKVASVSALIEVEDAIWLCDDQLENQYRRFHNGS